MPGDQRDDHQHRTDVEDGDAPHRRAHGLRHAPHRVLGLGRRDGHRLQAAVGEEGGQQTGHQALRAAREEAALADEVGGAGGVGAGQQAEHGHGAQQEEEDDRGDLQGGEPELVLAEVPHRQQVGPAEDRHEHGDPQPVRRAREPLGHDRRGAQRLRGDGDAQQRPEDPPGGEAGPGADRAFGVHGEGTGGGVGGRHLAEHPHHQHHQQPGGRVRQHDRRAGGGDARTGTDEEAGADHAAESDHRQMPLSQTVGEGGAFGAGRSLGGRGLGLQIGCSGHGDGVPSWRGRGYGTTCSGSGQCGGGSHPRARGTLLVRHTDTPVTLRTPRWARRNHGAARRVRPVPPPHGRTPQAEPGSFVANLTGERGLTSVNVGSSPEAPTTPEP